MATVTGTTSAKVQEIETNQVVSGAVNAAGHMVLTKQGGGTIDAGPVVAPAGAVMMFAGAVPPTGWLFCNGQAVSRASFPALFAAIGSAYGDGDHVSTFNVPDMEAKLPRMEVAALGATGGSVATHTHTGPSHTHTGPSHAHSLDGGSPQAYAASSTGGALPGVTTFKRITTPSWTATHHNPLSLDFTSDSTSPVTGLQVGGNTVAEGTENTGSGGTAATGSGGGGLPPYLNINFIIKT